MVVEGLTCKTPSGETLRVREVWQENLEEEFDLIRDIVDEYPFVAMDTEFPGVVARPVGNFKNSGEYHFQTLRYAHIISFWLYMGYTWQLVRTQRLRSFNSMDVVTQTQTDLLISAALSHQQANNL